VRQLYYQAVAKELIDKTEAEYKAFCRVLSNMRRAGSLPYSWFADHTRWRHKPASHGDLEGMLSRSRQTYRKAIWLAQPRYVEVWIEKAALIGVVLPVTAEWDVPLLPCRGYPSLTYLFEAAEELKEIDKPTSTYYFGDHDPSGCHISVKIGCLTEGITVKVSISALLQAVQWQHKLVQGGIECQRPKLLKATPDSGNKAYGALETGPQSDPTRAADRCNSDTQIECESSDERGEAF